MLAVSPGCFSSHGPRDDIRSTLVYRLLELVSNYRWPCGMKLDMYGSRKNLNNIYIHIHNMTTNNGKLTYVVKVYLLIQVVTLQINNIICFNRSIYDNGNESTPLQFTSI
jgi:hypothetical protein